MKTLLAYHYDPHFDVSSIKRKDAHLYDETNLIGPHEGRVLPLFELGKKGVAILSPNSLEYKELMTYIDSDQLQVLDASFSIDNKVVFPQAVIYRPQLKEDALFVKSFLIENANLMFKKQKRPLEEQINLHIKIGKILGYPQKSIEAFCKNVNKTHALSTMQSMREKAADKNINKIIM